MKRLLIAMACAACAGLVSAQDAPKAPAVPAPTPSAPVASADVAAKQPNRFPRARRERPDGMRGPYGLRGRSGPGGEDRVSRSFSTLFREESKKTQGLFSKIHPDYVPPRADGTGDTFKAGDRVLHKKFGEGTVVSVKQTADGQEVKVAFAGGGIRSLLTKYAVLKKL